MRSPSPVILCIDDSLISTAARAQVLRSQGFSVLCATSAADAEKIVNGTEHIDLVLLDFFLGDTDASAVLPAIKSARPELKVALLTGSAEFSEFEGAEAVLLKPISPRKLADEVHRLISGGSAQSNQSENHTS